MRGGSSNSCLVADAMNVNVPSMGIDLTPAIKRGLQSVEPEYPMHNGGSGPAMPSVANGPPIPEDRANRPASTDSCRDPVQSQRCLIGALLLSQSKT
jgi:hypothetical protein